jgi:hypothetical protein
MNIKGNKKACKNLDDNIGMPFCKNNKVLFMNQKEKNKMLDQIVFEIVKDTVSQKILRGIVSLGYVNTDTLIQRPGEIILSDLNKVKRFFNF